jgi:hypothetical protein
MLASTAMPTVSTMPAMPGSVSVARRNARPPMNITRFVSSASAAKTPRRR